MGSSLLSIVAVEKDEALGGQHTAYAYVFRQSTRPDNLTVQAAAS